MDILGSLFTVSLVALLGALSRKIILFERQQIKVLSAFIYYFGLPSLFFASLAGTEFRALDPTLLIGSLSPILLLLAIFSLLRFAGLLNKENFILASLSISFGSYAFFGVAFFETLQGGKFLPMIMVTASLLGMSGIILSLTLFEYGRQAGLSLVFFKKIVANPLIIAIALGTFCSLSGFHLPPLEDALTLLGKTSGGMAIFVLGMFIYDNFSLHSVREALAYSLVRVITLPLITIIYITLVPGNDPQTDTFLVLQSGIPAAISLAVFAERYNYQLSVVSGMVILTSILSVGELFLLSVLVDFMVG